jgi:hypothetical protein
MVDIKAAVNIAAKFLSDNLPNSTAIRLEEIESEFDDRYSSWCWVITLSYIEKSEVDMLTKLGMPDYNLSRVYKVISVDKNTGEVYSMKIRQGVNA